MKLVDVVRAEQERVLEGLALKPTRHPAYMHVTEGAFQRSVVQTATPWGWATAHFHDSRRQVRPGVFVGDRAAAGFPDLVLARERLIIAELKTEMGRLTAAQRDWLVLLRQAGVEVYVWRPSMGRQILETLTTTRRPPLETAS